MKRNLWFWLYFVFAIILAIYFSARVIMTFMGYGPVANIRNISMTADTKNKDLTPLLASVGVAGGTNSYAVNLNTVNERLLQSPGVRESAVRRLPNGNLVIRVRMYKAVASWTDGNYYYPVSADGNVVNQPSEDKPNGAVVFRGALPNDISDITKAATNLIGELNYLEWVDGHRWNVHTNGNITILLPETDPVSALGTVITLHKKHKLLSKDLTVIDMRDTARVLVK